MDMKNPKNTLFCKHLLTLRLRPSQNRHTAPYMGVHAKLPPRTLRLDESYA